VEAARSHPESQRQVALTPILVCCNGCRRTVKPCGRRYACASTC
jgi:hypothetical protein